MQEYHKIRPIRISDEVWKMLKQQKKRGLTWDRFFKKIISKQKIVLQNSKENKDQDKPKKPKIVIQNIEEEKQIVLQKVKSMFQSQDRRMPIIAYYWHMKEINFETIAAYESGLRRELRASADLKGYTNDQIKKTVQWLKENADFKWTLETVHKYIDEPLENLSKSGKPKTEEELFKEKQAYYANLNQQSHALS